MFHLCAHSLLLLRTRPDPGSSCWYRCFCFKRNLPLHAERDICSCLLVVPLSIFQLLNPSLLLQLLFMFSYKPLSSTSDAFGYLSSIGPKISDLFQFLCKWSLLFFILTVAFLMNSGKKSSKDFFVSQLLKLQIFKKSFKNNTVTVSVYHISIY